MDGTSWPRTAKHQRLSLDTMVGWGDKVKETFKASVNLMLIKDPKILVPSQDLTSDQFDPTESFSEAEAHAIDKAVSVILFKVIHTNARTVLPCADEFEAMYRAGGAHLCFRLLRLHSLSM